jgi:hypothetical protein
MTNMLGFVLAHESDLHNDSFIPSSLLQFWNPELKEAIRIPA